MIYKLILKPRAENDLADSIEWYESRKRGLGKKFVNHLESYFEKISENPLNYQIQNPPFREAYIQKFPFVIIYEVSESEVIVYSIFNTNRNPENKP